MFSMEDARAKILGCVGPLGSACGDVGDDLQKYELAPCPDNVGDVCNLDDVTVDFHVEFWASLCQDLAATLQVSRSINVAVPENFNVLFCLALQNLDAVVYCDLAEPGKTAQLEQFRVVEETAAALFGCWNLEKIDIGREGNKSTVTVKCFSPQLVTLLQLNYG